MELTVSLTASEMEALKAAFPEADPAEAALMLLRAEMQRRYRKERKAGQLIKMRASKSPKA